jgi:CheY-like chemotaxis protein
MYRIGVVDDDELYGLAIQRFFSREFEVSFFPKISSFLQEPCSYDLVIVDYSIPCANYENQMDGCQLICQLKTGLSNPPLIILLSGFLSQNNLEIGKEICPEADEFCAKDAGLEVILQQVKRLLATRYLSLN